MAGFGSNEADLQAKYDEGVAVGEANGAAICAAQHFITNFYGNGTTTASFYIPFEPDLLLVAGFSPLAYKGVDKASMAVFDFRAFGAVGGIGTYGNTNGMANTMYGTSSSRFTQAENGMFTINGLSGSRTVVFDSQIVYTVVAVKYTEQTDKERITEFVNHLTGSGTATLYQKKVEAAFTDEEWADLIATKPDWTFTWI